MVDEVETITTQVGLVWTYRYANKALEAIKDFAGRMTSVSVVGGNLMQITEPDPGSNQPGASSRVSRMPARCSGSTASPTPRARQRGLGRTPTSCIRVNDYRSEVAWLQARSSPDASEHSRADLFTFVECEHIIGINVPATKSGEARQLPCVDRPDLVAGTNGGRHRSVPDDNLGADEL